MKPQPDRRSGSDRRTPTSEATGWLLEDVRMTRGFLLAVVLVMFSFMAFGAWSAVATVRDLRDDDCANANERRAELRAIAHELVDNDRFLISVADSLSEDGLPDEFINPLEARWTEQDARIDVAYAGPVCD